jgi:hypothetical protein
MQIKPWDYAMQRLSDAKWSYVTRRIIDRQAMRLDSFISPPRLGDLVASSVTFVGEHDSLEDVHGRRARLYPGDIVVGAYGNRYATDFYEGYLPSGPEAHLLTAGGVVGVVASAHAHRGPPTELKVIGTLTDPGGTPMSLENLALPAPPPTRAALGTVVVVGSSMSAGKTTTAASMVNGWTRAGLTAAAGKVTGSGSGKDRWMYLDAGATAVIDFLDFGMPSTFGYPVDRLRATMIGIRDELAHRRSDAVVLEIADGLLQAETAALISSLPGFADAVVLAVRDPLSAVAGVRILHDLGVPVRAISGLVTASPLASQEASAATGLDVLSPAALANGAAVQLLTPRLGAAV